MSYSTIQKTVHLDLCCSCGVCKGICPKNCITWIKKDGLYLPQIDESQCVQCGLCVDVCPGLSHRYTPCGSAMQTISGPVLSCHTAWSKNPDLRHISASGGVISSLIQELLGSGLYDGAFCLDTYDYRNQLCTRLFTAEDIASDWSRSSPKSRYLPVSHEHAVAYIKQHRNARLIFVGTSCAIRGLLAAVAKRNLNREQYLFIGLFCDQVFNYHVLSYFQNTYANGSPLDALHFKNKESGGWPGNMKFFPKNGDAFYVPMSERAKAKAYFMPQRCLYCVDKLNVCADLSLGDNYTGKDDSKLGSNSVIIRTPIGEKAWLTAKSLLETRPAQLSDIQKAQYLEGRLNNLYFAEVKSSQTSCHLDLNPGIPKEQDHTEFIQTWNHRMYQIRAGASYDLHPQLLTKQIRKDNKKLNPITRFIKRCYHFIKRRMK